VIPNWAPLERLDIYPRHNDWSTEQGLNDKFIFLYTGTLGFKHDPDILLQLAEHFRNDSDVAVVVVSTGPGADYLKAKLEVDHGLNLIVLPLQSMESYAQVLATGDVLVAILDPEGTAFSVPSKVLSYFCAGRPILASIPEENEAARIIMQTQAGIVWPPGDHEKFIDTAESLYRNDVLRDQMGKHGRAYAEANFPIRPIGDNFEKVISGIE
jgi:glycosyltransferase involved in cell wall biosynthesis